MRSKAIIRKEREGALARRHDQFLFSSRSSWRVGIETKIAGLVKLAVK